MNEAQNNGDDVSQIKPKLESTRSSFDPQKAKLEKIHILIHELQELVGKEDLYISRYEYLVIIILKLRELTELTNTVGDDLANALKDLKLVSAKLSGMDSEKKLGDLLAFLVNQKEIL